MSEPTAAPAPTPIPKRRGRRILRILGIVAILLVVLILAGPWFVAHTGLRDKLINATEFPRRFLQAAGSCKTVAPCPHRIRVFDRPVVESFAGFHA